MSMKYKTATEVWNALAAAEKGQARADIIKTRHNRNLILNSGSFVTFSTGKVNESGQTYKEKLADIRVLQTQRLHIKTAAYDGKGTFGGLSERTKLDENLMANIVVTAANLAGKTIDELTQSAFRQQLERLIALKDDLKIGESGKIEHISDLTEIARVTAARESMEEALEIIAARDIHQKLGITKENLRYIFKEAALTPVPLSRVMDDNFVINIWDGDLKNPAYAVTPFGHLATLKETVFDEIIAAGLAKMTQGQSEILNDPTRRNLIGREILGIEGVPLFESLKQWGKNNTDGSRDLSSDYRYPHEWISLWYKAQVTLGFNQGAGGGLGYRQVGMISLIKEVQQSIIDEAKAKGEVPYNINFIGALTQMNGGRLNDISQLEGFEEDFGLPHETFYEMHKAAEAVMRENGFEPTSPFIASHEKITKAVAPVPQA